MRPPPVRRLLPWPWPCAYRLPRSSSLPPEFCNAVACPSPTRLPRHSLVLTTHHHAHHAHYAHYAHYRLRPPHAQAGLRPRCPSSPSSITHPVASSTPRHDTTRHDTAAAALTTSARAGAIIIRRPSFGLQQRAPSGRAWNGNPTLDDSTSLCIFFFADRYLSTPTSLYLSTPLPSAPLAPQASPQQPSLLSWVLRPCLAPCPLHLVYPQAVG